mgnify:FL=1
MKKSIQFSILITLFFILNSCIIQNPKPEECVVIETTLLKIKEGSTFDIVFFDRSDRYYINRGIELGLILDSLNAKVLNKTVTLHLPKVLGGMATSEHIAQLAVGNEIIFTEFN